MVEVIVNTFIHFIALANLILGFLIISRNPKNPTNVIFFILILLLVIFDLSSHYVDQPVLKIELQSLMLRVDYFSGVMTAYFFLLFSYNFPKFKGFLSNKLLLFLFAMSFVGGVIAFSTDLMIRDVQATLDGTLFTLGPMDLPFIAFCLGMGFAGIYLLVKSLKSNYGEERLRVTYVILGSSITAGIILVSLIVERVLLQLGLVDYIPLVRMSRFSTIIFTLFTTYAIVRHRLFGIRVVLGKLLFWVGTATFLFTVFYVVALLEQQYLGSFTSPGVITLNAFLALFIGLLFHRYERNLYKLVNRYIVYFTYDPKEVTEDFITEVTTIKTEQDVFDKLFSTVKETLNPIKQGIEVGVLNEGSGEPTVLWQNVSQDEIKQVENTELINEFMNKKPNQAILRTELEAENGNDKVVEILKKLSIEVVLPIQRGQVVGLYVLGERANKDAYALEDLAFLEKLVYYASLNVARMQK